MKLALLISGALTALVLLFPGFIIIGYFLLLVPGLVLQWMPTVFLYLLATFLIGKLLPIENPYLAHAVAFGIAITIASLIVQPIKWRAEAEFARVQQPNIAPPGKLKLTGDVVLQKIGNAPSKFEPSCDALCFALLDQTDISSVTIIAYGHTVTFKLVDVDPADPEAPQSEAPYEPGLLSEVLIASGSWEERQKINAEWEARLSGPQRLVKTAIPQQFDWRLVDQGESKDGSPTIIRVVISDAAGEVKFRKSKIWHRIPTVPPYVQFSAGGADTGFGNRRFGLSARQVLAEETELGRGDSELARVIELPTDWGK